MTTDLKDLDRRDMLAAKIQQLEAIARDSIASGRENNAIGAIRLLSELVGLGVERTMRQEMDLYLSSVTVITTDDQSLKSQC